MVREVPVEKMLKSIKNAIARICCDTIEKDTSFDMMLQKPTLEMLKNIELQMHKDMKKIDNIKESAI